MAIRRGKLRRASAIAAGATALAITLAACASDDTGPGDADADYGDLAIQLSWILNSEFAGEFFAIERGYFEDAGFSDVDLIPGPAATEAAVISGTVDVGLGNAVSTGAVIANEGAPLKIIGSTYQINPFTILSLADQGNIQTVDDLVGKTIGVQASNQNLWEAFLSLNDLTLDDVNTQPVEFDPSPLFANNSEYDGWFAYFINESLDAEILGLNPVDLRLHDNGFPFVAETFIVTDDAIANDREKLKAFLVAEIRGWTDAVNEIEEAARLAVEVYGVDYGLTMEKELLFSQIQAEEIVVSAETEANGLFTVSDALIAQTLNSLAAAGYELEADELFDLSLLAEVYDENPELLDYAG